MKKQKNKKYVTNCYNLIPIRNEILPKIDFF